MLLLNSKPFITLDSYLDISKFKSLEDDFYFLYSKNIHYGKATWNSGGIPVDLSWPYIAENHFLYHVYHRAKQEGNQAILKIIDHFESTNDKDGLARFLQLKFGAFNPYRILHLNSYRKPLHDFVDNPVKDWVHSLPFESIDMVSMFFNDHYCPLKYHQDYNYFPYEEGDHREIPNTLQDLIWFRFDLKRGFNLYDIDKDGNILNTVPVEGYSATFNHYNWHGNTDAYDKASLTIKVEGKFTAEFKEKIYA